MFSVEGSIKKEDDVHKLCAKDVTISPGTNKFTLSMKVVNTLIKIIIINLISDFKTLSIG